MLENIYGLMSLFGAMAAMNDVNPMAAKLAMPTKKLKPATARDNKRDAEVYNHNAHVEYTQRQSLRRKFLKAIKHDFEYKGKSRRQLINSRKNVINMMYNDNRMNIA